jgi:hypothetical protein
MVRQGWALSYAISCSECYKVGLVPSNAFSVIDLLQNIASSHIDRAVEVLGALLSDPRLDQWT